MDCKELYAQKLMTAAQAAALVKRCEALGPKLK